MPASMRIKDHLVDHAILALHQTYISYIGATANLNLGSFNLITTGNLSDGTNSLTVANAKTAYDHSQNNTQAHSDYMLNTGDTSTGDYDFTAGNLTTTGTISNLADNSKHVFGLEGATDSYIQYTGSKLDLYSVGGATLTDAVGDYINFLDDYYGLEVYTSNNPRTAIRGTNNDSGNLGELGTSTYGVYGYVGTAGTAVYGTHNNGNIGELATDNYGVYGYGSSDPAGFFDDGTRSVYLADGTYVINATGNSLFTGNLTTTGSYYFPVTNITTGAGIIFQDSARFIHSQLPTNQTPTYSNVFIGKNAGSTLLDNTTSAWHGTGNISMGEATLDALTTGYYNFALGTSSGSSITTGADNVLIGHQSGNAISEGGQNVLLGRDAGLAITNESNNVGVGSNSLRATSGHRSVSVGVNALRNNTNATGRNVAIGYQAGQDNTGTASVFIGYNAGLSQAGSNKLHIANADSATPLIYGEFDTGFVTINGYLNVTGTVNTSEIKTDTTTPTDLTITTGAAKTLVLATIVYDDLQFQVSSAKTNPANVAPTWETFTPTTSEYAFSVNDEVDSYANEIPHWWKEGTTGNAHLHITTKAVPAQEQKARFTVTFAYADIDEVWVEAPLTAELTIPISTTALTNFYLDLGDLTLTNYLVGAQIRCRIKRVAKSAGGTEYVGDIFITQAGIHLEKTRLGSRAETTS